MAKKSEIKELEKLDIDMLTAEEIFKASDEMPHVKKNYPNFWKLHEMMMNMNQGLEALQAEFEKEKEGEEMKVMNQEELLSQRKSSYILVIVGFVLDFIMMLLTGFEVLSAIWGISFLILFTMLSILFVIDIRYCDTILRLQFDVGKEAK